MSDRFDDPEPDLVESLLEDPLEVGEDAVRDDPLEDPLENLPGRSCRDHDD